MSEEQALILFAQQIVEEASEKMFIDTLCLIIHNRRHYDVLSLEERFGSQGQDDRYLARQILNWSQK